MRGGWPVLRMPIRKIFTAPQRTKAVQRMSMTMVPIRSNKGGSAAAIYGSKATNGVVIITTKRGQAGKPQFGLTQRLGVFTRANELGPD